MFCPLKHEKTHPGMWSHFSLFVMLLAPRLNRTNKQMGNFMKVCLFPICLCHFLDFYMRNESTFRTGTLSWSTNREQSSCFCLTLKSRVFLLCQLIFWQFFVNYSTVDCKYLFFLQDFFYRLKPKQYKKCQYSWLFKKNIWKLVKQNKLNVKFFDKKLSKN